MITPRKFFTSYSRQDKKWFTERQGFWIGGHFIVSNLSKGYHGILTQWWQHYKNPEETCNVLLISETNLVKNEFCSLYPKWSFTTLGIEAESELVCDICCSSDVMKIKSKFDLIINQATLEHVYDPFGAMKNLSWLLNKNGIIVCHTHPPNFPYHAYPHDCFRFMKDWWFIIQDKINLSLQELLIYNDEHVFSCYEKQ